MKKRHSIRLKDYDYSEPGYYFVTILAHRRDFLFGMIKDAKMHLNHWGEIVRQCWNEIPNHFPGVSVDEFVVMPNYVHGIVIIRQSRESFVRATHASPLPSKLSSPCGPRSRSLGAILGSFKSVVTKRIHEVSGNISDRVWHRNYYEHVIRNESELSEAREYIQNNPMQWDLDPENSVITDCRRDPVSAAGGRPGVPATEFAHR